MHKKLRLGVAVAAAMVATSVAGYAVASTVSPSSFVSAGTVRFAMVSASSPQTTTSTTYVNIPGMNTGFNVPPGKTADVMITFSGEVNTCHAMLVRAVVDGSAALPSETQFQWNLSGGADSHAFSFFTKVGPGVHNVAVQWHGLYTCAQEFISNRSTIITVNLH